MFNFNPKIGYYLLFLSVLLFFASGCETIISLQSGDVNMQDVARMVKYGGGTPKEKESRGAFPSESTMRKADNWLQKNLW